MCNVVGAALGYVWYLGQMQQTVWYLRLFVPDSPLSVTLFIAAFLLSRWHKASRLTGLVSALGVTWMIKYGLWCVYILGFARVSAGALHFEGWVLITTHALMVTEAVLYSRVVPYLRFTLADLLVAFATLLINDYVDYVYGVFPYLPRLSMLPMMTVLTPIITLLVIAYWFLRLHRQKVNPSPSTS